MSVRGLHSATVVSGDELDVLITGTQELFATILESKPRSSTRGYR